MKLLNDVYIDIRSEINKSVLVKRYKFTHEQIIINFHNNLSDDANIINIVYHQTIKSRWKNMKCKVEYTDTFGGEANYSWVSSCSNKYMQNYANLCKTS